MPVDGIFNPALNDTALGYLALGWSVLPLYGDVDPDRPKVAALAWEPFQRRRAREDEVASWFKRSDVSALGIITGAVSQLVVLDFDTSELLQEFTRSCPELLVTRTVTTSRGQHLYFRLPPQLALRSQRLDGLDLLAGGRYVVAPPSVIDGFTYSIRRGGLPKMLTQADIARIDAFLATTRAETHRQPSEVRVATPPVETQEGAVSREIEPFSEATPSTETPEHSLLTTDALVRLYRSLASQSKRNIALFKVSCLARDQGWSYAAVVETLADAHATQTAHGQHRVEKEKSRYREALATIRSVFSRPARQMKPTDIGGLYNTLREKFFCLGQTCVVRVLEGLHLTGLQAGQLITESQIVHILHGLVGRRSIRSALQALSPTSQSIFEKISPHHPPQSSAAKQIRIVNTTNAFVSISKRNKNRGRPSSVFRIPSLARLCALLDVRPSGSDPLTLNDLASSRKTRQAAHRELIRRRPGLYLRQWLANRLGVSSVTIWRYGHTIDGFHVTPTYTSTRLDWHNLSAIPSEAMYARGTFLEDDRGQRWPARKGIAIRLLGQGRIIRLLVQSLNYYAYGTGDLLAIDPEFKRERLLSNSKAAPSLLTLAERVQRLVRSLPIVQIEATANAVLELPSVVNRPTLSIEYVGNEYANKLRKANRQEWQPLERPNEEILAQRLYAQVNQATADTRHKLSLVTARRWIVRYGATQVEQALQRVVQRRDVRNRAGLIATLLRTAGHVSP